MVLVIDDDPSTRMLIRVILESNGHSVVEAVHGGEALDLIGASPVPDVVVTDMTMPVMNGTELIERLQSEPRTATIPIVVVSGNSDAALGLQTSGLVQAVVTKPFHPTALARCIRAITSNPISSVRVGY